MVQNKQLLFPQNLNEVLDHNWAKWKKQPLESTNEFSCNFCLSLLKDKLLTCSLET